MKNAFIKAILVVGVAATFTGCGTTNFIDQMNAQYGQAMEQGQSQLALYQDPRNLAADGTLFAAGEIVKIETVEVQTTNSTGTLAGSYLGVVGKLGGMAVDAARNEKDVETPSKYHFLSDTGVSISLTQPSEEEYEQAFVVGQKVVLQSSKPLTEGENTIFLSVR